MGLLSMCLFMLFCCLLTAICPQGAIHIASHLLFVRWNWYANDGTFWMFRAFLLETQYDSSAYFLYPFEERAYRTH